MTRSHRMSRFTKMKTMNLIFLIFTTLFFSSQVYCYPGMVGIAGKSKNCIVCHANNGGWDDGKTIVDIVDKETLKSYKQPDGSFSIDVKRNEQKTIILILGRPKEESSLPVRNAWLLLDTSKIQSSGL